MTDHEPRRERPRPEAPTQQTNNTGQAGHTSRRRLLSLLGAGGVAGIAGCTGGRQDETDTPTAGEGDGEGSSDDTETLQQSATIALRTDLTRDVWGVYGGVMPYYTNILEPLLWVSKNLRPKPWLATDWERTGEKTFVFTLREGVKFHNGDVLTADEVVWSIETILNEWTWASESWPIAGIQKIDDMTVEFTNNNVFPEFPGAISHNMVAIQHPDRDRETNKIIGTGPYQVEAYKKGQHVKTSAFEEYWRGPPKMDALTFRVMTDANTRTLALTGHDIDVAFNPPRNKVQSLTASDKTKVVTQEAPHSGWVEINFSKTPTDDRKLRKALNYAVSQETIVETVLNGLGVPARGMIAPSIYWSAHDELPEYGPDREKAKQLVDQSSYNGETLQFIMNTQEPIDGKLMAEVIQQSASKIGVDIEIRVMEKAAFDEAEANGNGHFFLWAGGPNNAAADYLLFDFWTDGQGPNWNDIGDHFDAPFEKGYRAADQEEKTEAYVEAQKVMLEEAVIIPIFHEEYAVGTYKDIEGLDLYPIGEMSRWTKLKHVEVE